MAKTKEERLREKQQERAAKLSPRPVLLPSGRWRCQVMVNGEWLSAVEDDPEIAHATVLAMKAGLIERKKSPKHMSIGEAVDRYIESKDSVLSPATILGYKKIKKNSMEDIVDVKLPDLTQEKVQRWVNKLAKSKSPKSIRNAHGLLSAVLAEYRPDLALRTTLPQKNVQQISIPSEEEIEKIMHGCAGRPEELPILLAMWLGLRASEIRGLTWGDVQNGRLHVRQAIVDGEDGPILKKTKTIAGDRWIKLPQYIIDLIDAQPRKGDYIVTMTGRAMYMRFYRLCERLGIQHYRFHDLRHTAASVSVILGVPTKYSQQRMGHQTDHMLKSVYEHTMRAKEDEYADRINQYYEEKLHTDLHTKSGGVIAP